MTAHDAPPPRDTEGGEGSSETLLFLGIAAGAVGGGLLGWLAPEAAAGMQVLGDLFLRLLRMLVLPLIVTSMVVGVANLGDVRRLRGLGGLTVAYYLSTSALALALGLVLVNWIEPGRGIDIRDARAPEVAAAAEGVGWGDLARSLVTPNLVRAASEFDILPVILFSLAFGAALSTLGERGRPALAVFDGCNEAVMALVHLVMWTAPVGVFGLVAGRFGKAGGGAEILEMLGAVGLFAATVVGGLLVHGLVVLPGLLWLLTGRNPLRYLRGVGTAVLTAFATASSSATMPVTIEATEEQNGVAEHATRFVLPLGATVNMDGTALYEAVAVLFIAQAWGIDLPLGSQVMLFVVATLSSVGAAGIPEAGMVTMVIVLEAVGLPLEGLGLLLAIDWLLDRFRTAVNVWGDAVGAAVVEDLGDRWGLVDGEALAAAAG